MADEGRPSKYDSNFADQARKLCELGATDAEIASFFEVSVRTIYTWKLQHDEFLQALKRGKEVADSLVENRLFARATGYSQDATKIFQYEGDPITVDYVEHFPPDTAACIFWLCNRRPQEWRQRREHTGGDGGPIQHTHTVDAFTGRITRLAARNAEDAGDSEPDGS